MGFGSPALIALWVLASLLLDPGGLCYSDYNQMRGFDDYGQGGDLGSGGFGTDPTVPRQNICFSPMGQQQPCPSSDRPPEKPSSPEGEVFPMPASPSPPSWSSSPPPPPSGRPPAPKQNTPRNEWNGSPPEVGVQGQKESSNSYAARLGWAFLAAAVVLQLVLGAYLAYKRRELERFGMWLEQIPSISPPPSPAGFAPYTAAR